MARWYQCGLWVETCIQCKTPFGMSDLVYQAARERCENFSFFCPNGHAQHYGRGESDEQKLRRERDQLKQQIAYHEDMRRQEQERREAAERTAAAFKGVATRLKNRAKAGMCPCCRRSFQNLRRHIAQQHPDYDNVVNIRKEARTAVENAK